MLWGRGGPADGGEHTVIRPVRRPKRKAYEGGRMGPIRVHEFISLDGVIDAPT